jgi:WD40 repeat protein
MNTSDVFISYRRKDVEFVKQLSAAFTQQQRDVWVDWEDIPPGVSDFSREIGMGIEGANIFVAVLSPDYLGSEYCLHELDYADQLNKRIIPIVYRSIDGSAVPECIRLINWVYFIPHAGQVNEFSTAFQAVLQAMDTNYDYVREHTRLLARALDWQNSEKNSSFFLSGDELNAAEQWLSTAAGQSPHPAHIQTDYILRSRQSQTRRQRRLLSGALALLVLAVVGLIVAVVAGVEARQQQMIAERRAAETLSLAAANTAAETAASGDYLQGLSLAHFASTFIDNPPVQALQTLRQLAFQPGTRYAFFDDLPPDMNTLGLNPGESAGSSGQSQSETTLIVEDEATFTLRDAGGEVMMRLNRLIGPPFRGYGFIDERINAEVVRQYENPLAAYAALDIMPDGAYVAIGTEQGLVIVDNAAAAEYRRPEGHTLPVDGVRFSRDGRYLVSRGSTDTLSNVAVIDREFIVWETTYWQPILQLNDFQRQRDLVAFSDDGQHLLFLEESPPGYTLWDVRDSRQVWSIREGYVVIELAFNPDGKSLVVSNLFTLRMRPPHDFTIYDLKGRRINRMSGQPGDDAIDVPILFNPDGSRLRLIKTDGRLIEVDMQTGEEIYIGNLPVSNVVGRSASGQFIALQDHDNNVVIFWDLEGAEPVGQFDDEVFGAAAVISDDGRYAAFDLFGRGLVIHDLTNDGVEAARFDDFRGSGFVGSVAYGYGPTSAALFYADVLGNVRVVETGSWRETAILRGLVGTVSDLAINADGTLVAAAGESGTVVVWDTASGVALQRIEGVGTVAKVAFAPDGWSIATGDERGQISFWQLIGSEDVLAWVDYNRVVIPVTCDTLIQASIIATRAGCPLSQ